MIIMECDLCSGKELQISYPVPTTRRNLSIYVCKNCGLVQSFPKIDHIKDDNIAISGDADWGNVRYGKAFVSKKAINILSETIKLEKIENCLDIGSNRGSFVIGLKRIFPNIDFVAIEPDEKIIDVYSNDHKIKVINERFENVKLEKNSFDLVYCSHTLEHLKSPKQSLKKIFNIIKQNGILYLEVPNLNAISNSSMVEEWFIDKHLYHFSLELLEKYLLIENFEIIYKDSSDDLNITIIAKKQKSNNLKCNLENLSEYRKNIKLIERYCNTLKINQFKLKKVGEKINKLSKENKMIIWGAGRILDRLVKLGNLELQTINGLVDKFLPQYLDQIKGITLKNPNEVNWNDQEIVFIASREYFDEIKEEVMKNNGKLKIIGLAELLEEEI